jgi:hypothetical protein
MKVSIRVHCLPPLFKKVDDIYDLIVVLAESSENARDENQCEEGEVAAAAANQKVDFLDGSNKKIR